MTPPPPQVSWQSTVKMGMPLAKIGRGFGEIQIPAGDGTHGDNFALQNPNGMTFIIGTQSAKFPMHVPPQKASDGVALKADGQDPHEHAHMAPVVATNAIKE